MTTFVCTDPENPDIDRQLARHKGETLLWRVQVRRGSMRSRAAVSLSAPFLGWNLPTSRLLIVSRRVTP